MELSKDERIAAHQAYHLLGQPVTAEKLNRAYLKGMIPLSELVDGKSYYGHCRNATIAVWHASKQKFTYIRTKFGDSFEEDIVHPEQDEGYDIFVPMKEA